MSVERLEEIPDFTEIASLSGSRCDYCMRKFYGDHVVILRGKTYHKACIPKAIRLQQNANNKTEGVQI